MKNKKDQLLEQFDAFKINEVKTSSRIKGGQKPGDTASWVEHTYDRISFDHIFHTDDPFQVPSSNG
ncbi:MAG: hypothetical protein R3C61_26125 [Bacteroidia bacterium]